MTSRIVTLFGEETPPEQLNAVGKSRATNKAKKVKEELEKVSLKQPAKTAAKKDDILDGWAADKQYYSIGEVATLFKVNTSHIRFWTNEFALKVRTTRKGDRLYTPAQIKEIRTIYHLVKQKKYTISGAKDRLKANKKMVVESVDLKQSLLQLRNKLLTIRNQIK